MTRSTVRRLGTARRRARLALVILAIRHLGRPGDVFDRVQHGTVDNAGVKIHYATLGKGPLVVMVHGFPDFWYSWRDQMAALLGLVPDRGDRSARLQPERQAEGAGAVRHDAAGQRRSRGGAAASHRAGPSSSGTTGEDLSRGTSRCGIRSSTERLIILNLPHPRGLMRELANNPAQQAEFGLRAAIPGARRRENVDRGRSCAPHHRSGDQGPLRRSLQPLRFRSDAATTTSRTIRARRTQEDHVAAGQGARRPCSMIHGLNDTALLPGRSTAPGSGSRAADDRDGPRRRSLGPE